MRKSIILLLLSLIFQTAITSPAFAEGNPFMDWISRVFAGLFHQTDKENLLLLQSREDLKAFSEEAKKVEEERKLLLNKRKEILAALKEDNQKIAESLQSNFPEDKEEINRLKELNQMLTKEYDLLDTNGEAIERSLKALDRLLADDLNTYLSQPEKLGTVEAKEFQRRIGETLQKEDDLLTSLRLNQERLLSSYDTAHFKMRQTLRSLENYRGINRFQNTYSAVTQDDQKILEQLKDNEAKVSQNYSGHVQTQEKLAANISDTLKPVKADVSQNSSRKDIDLDDTGWKHLEEAEDRIHRESKEQMQRQREAAHDRGFDNFPGSIK
ncbi:MAG: hypothetical protein A2Z88_09400 [Omnitrophica WOR_2 bacterium GWA2_47_8]|nr:MAG: hypothetical protein A2Z88_09400 [Omnitrophica WOR_2 bacterium GWA2_47_8]